MGHDPGDDDPLERRRRRDYRDVGGTSGGLGEFLGGVALLAGGGYLLTTQIVVASSLRSLFGYDHAFGLLLIPIFAGVVLLFANGRSVMGWILSVGGVAAVLAGVLADLQVYFKPTSLFATLAMLVLLASGLGLVLRALRSHDA